MTSQKTDICMIYDQIIFVKRQPKLTADAVAYIFNGYHILMTFILKSFFLL